MSKYLGEASIAMMGGVSWWLELRGFVPQDAPYPYLLTRVDTRRERQYCVSCKTLEEVATVLNHDTDFVHINGGLTSVVSPPSEAGLWDDASLDAVVEECLEGRNAEANRRRINSYKQGEFYSEILSAVVPNPVPFERGKYADAMTGQRG